MTNTSTFKHGDQVYYVIGRTWNGKEIRVRYPYTFVRYAESRIDRDGDLGDRAIVRTSGNEFLHPNEEREEWAARLRLA